ncbi:hypothetical protein GCM10011496_03330 [Polaromonas eurypsychrophila]|uniref:Uncharacterized protein n=1 Tax=Polaromonas eurypsychrophila TaxID=1614635 RepID=A0A916S6Q5_9BURK|nr:hypothetical protein GCM10011496_03330 [Polaromonas eurypsychrophila]
MLGFAADRRAILAVQRHVEHAGAEFFDHFSLQLQAFAHPCLDAAVVVTDRQKTCCSLGAKEDVAGMCHIGFVIAGLTRNPYCET